MPERETTWAWETQSTHVPPQLLPLLQLLLSKLPVERNWRLGGGHYVTALSSGASRLSLSVPRPVGPELVELTYNLRSWNSTTNNWNNPNNSWNSTSSSWNDPNNSWTSTSNSRKSPVTSGAAPAAARAVPVAAGAAPAAARAAPAAAGTAPAAAGTAAAAAAASHAPKALARNGHTSCSTRHHLRAIVSLEILITYSDRKQKTSSIGR
ncbi:hypothetical protein FHG87_019013 [Trinorchestia longiramus]|nr:hypothetical protein FHG87_019013 [Trinorchestia longiramus]